MLKETDDHNAPPSSGGNSKEFTDDIPKDTKTVKCSTTDPNSACFCEGEYKNVFAYAIETACYKNGWILGYAVNYCNYQTAEPSKDFMIR